MLQASADYLQQVKDEITALKKGHKNTIYVIKGDFKLPVIDCEKNEQSPKILPTQSQLDLSRHSISTVILENSTWSLQHT